MPVVLFILCASQFGMTVAKGYITKKGQVDITADQQAVTVTTEKVKCYNKIYFDPYPTGIYCNRTFDEIACWPDTAPGVTHIQPCPNYIQGFYISGNATRKCMPNGQWYISPVTNATWTNYSQCLRSLPPPAVPKLVAVHVEYIQLVYNTGYGISFVSLVMAVFIMLHFRKLHCPRNTMHINLFISFILRAVLSFLKDILLVQGLGFSFDLERTPTDRMVFIENATHWECKLLLSMFHYALSANYMWILVEGLYLHTLVYVSVFSERKSMRWYYLLGWGTPLLSIIPWVIVRAKLENTLCWNTNPTSGYFWILKAPIVCSLVINFMFFINILRALFSRIHRPNTSSARRNRYRRLAKATLILIPLFGIHYTLFIGMPYKIDPTTEVVKLYVEMFFNSFQGFVVAVLFCFLNQEVQMEIRKKWYRLFSKPDPRYIQQSQYLADSIGNRRCRRDVNLNLSVSENNASSESSTDVTMCLCKWTLDKNGKLKHSFNMKNESVKSNGRLLQVQESKI